jgi:hypothetical protein
VIGSAVLYLGLAIAAAGSMLVARPIERVGVPTRAGAAVMIAAGVAVMAIAFVLPAPESRVSHPETRLDEFAPVWQFNERHTLRIAAPPARVFDAIKSVRADEISLFATLTWIRRGGRPLPEGILNAGVHEPIIDVATGTTFVRLAQDDPRELVVGTVIARPPGTRRTQTPEIFQQTLPPGFTLAAFNFLVTPEGSGSMVSTETRVFANSPAARRRFAAYWRVIYPGSALIRRMWLRAIARRALSALPQLKETR